MLTRISVFHITTELRSGVFYFVTVEIPPFQSCCVLTRCGTWLINNVGAIGFYDNVQFLPGRISSFFCSLVGCWSLRLGRRGSRTEPWDCGTYIHMLHDMTGSIV